MHYLGGACWGKGGAGHAAWAACWTWRHAGPQRWVCGSGICSQQQALMPASCLECSRQVALLAAANGTAVLVERHRLLARLIPSAPGAGTWLGGRGRGRPEGPGTDAQCRSCTQVCVLSSLMAIALLHTGLPEPQKDMPYRRAWCKLQTREAPAVRFIHR